MNLMVQKSVFCICISQAQAETIVEHLKNAGFYYNEISVLFPDRGTTLDFTPGKNARTPSGFSTAGMVDGIMGWLADIDALAIPGVGPFIAAGPIMAALSDVAFGGVAGGLASLGLPQPAARQYEAKIRAGGILVSAHADDTEEIAAAEKIFRNTGAQDICVTGEPEPPKKLYQVLREVAG
jgi:hypothetical protein